MPKLRNMLACCLTVLSFAMTFAACTGGMTNATAVIARPAYPGAVVIRKTFLSDAEPYCPSDRDNCCLVWLTTYATEDGVEEVVQFYTERGFMATGRPSSAEGRLVRWVAILDRDEPAWRRVDVATGEIAGRPNWTTVVELATAACPSTG